ncbi:unnamed protein product [Ectocarpus sp. 12 AP-2014]
MLTAFLPLYPSFRRRQRRSLCLVRVAARGATTTTNITNKMRDRQRQHGLISITCNTNGRAQTSSAV